MKAILYVVATAIFPFVWAYDLITGCNPRVRLRTAYDSIRNKAW
jgi:hypothetical protein